MYEFRHKNNNIPAHLLSLFLLVVRDPAKSWHPSKRRHGFSFSASRVAEKISSGRSPYSLESNGVYRFNGEKFRAGIGVGYHFTGLPIREDDNSNILRTYSFAPSVSFIGKFDYRWTGLLSFGRLSLVNMYLPLSNNQTLVGMRLINMGWDGYENATSNETFYQSGFFGVSAMHFFNKPLGAGLFGRVDAGLANFDHSNDNTEHSLLDENGFDLEVSIGYGVPLGKQTKILVSLDDNLASFPSGRVNTWAVSVGLMW